MGSFDSRLTLGLILGLIEKEGLRDGDILLLGGKESTGEGPKLGIELGYELVLGTILGN